MKCKIKRKKNLFRFLTLSFGRVSLPPVIGKQHIQIKRNIHLCRQLIRVVEAHQEFVALIHFFQRTQRKPIGLCTCK